VTTPLTLPLDGPGWTVYALEPGEALARRVWDAAPAGVEVLPAPVPGHAQNALLDAGTLPDPYVGLNSRQWTWTGERDWVYERSIPGPPSTSGMRFHLRFEALDGHAHVFLNGERVGEHHARFVPVEWDVASLLRPGVENRLTVVIEAYREPDESLEGRVQRWWGGTFHHPDFKLLGIPGSVTLKATGAARMLSIAPYINLSLDLSEAALSLAVEFDAMRDVPALIRTEITQESLPVTSVEDPITVRPDTSLVQSLTLKRVQLWWPNGYGRQPLYEARVSLLDRDENLLDFQTFRFGVRHLEQVACEGAPPDSLRYCIRVNDKPIWIKGWVWVPPDYLWGAVPEEKYERLLRLAKASGANLLRVPGGTVIEREAFYRCCDRLGLLVWQDFPLAGAQPLPADAVLGRALAPYAASAVARLRPHASLAAWGGGENLRIESGAAPDAAHPVVSELREAVLDEDSQKMWVPVPGGSGLALVRAAGHGEGAADGLRLAVEACRRDRARLTGVLVDSLDESSSASGAAIDHELRPTPAYYAVRRSYLPFHVTAAFPAESWDAETHFTADIWLHNDGPERSLLNVVATVVDDSGRELYQENLAGEALESSSESIGDLSWRFPEAFAGAFLLLLEVIDEEGDCLARNHYRHSRGTVPGAGETLLQVERTESGIRIRNTGPAVALAVEIEAGEALVDDSYFPLVPGGEREVRLSEPNAPVRVTAWNAPETTA
jgi:hypothetical protein